MSFYVPRCQIIGLDIGSKAIKVLRLTTSLTDFRITGFLVRERRGDSWEELAEDLRALSQEGALQGDVFVSSFPSHRVLFRSTEMPFTQLDKVEATIRYEAESTIIAPLEEMVVDFALLERTPQGSSVLVVCVYNELLQDYIETLHQGGIIPDTIDIDSLALGRLIEELEEEKRTIALLDLGAEKTSVSIFEGGRLRLTRSIPIDGGAEEASKEIIPVLKDVMFTVKAYQRAGEGTVEEVWLTGGRSLLDGLDGYLERGLGVKVHHLDFLTKFPTTVTLDQETNLLGGVSLGLALRGLRRERGRVDLAKKIPTPSQSITAQLRKSIVKVAVALLFLLAVVGVDFYLGLAIKEKRYTMLKAEVRRVFKEAFPGTKGGTNELQLARDLVRRMGEGGVKMGSHGGYSPLELLRELAVRLPQGTKIVELDLDEERITVRGMAPSFSVVDEVKESLTSSALFRNVTVGNVELARRGGPGVLFKMVLDREGK